MAKGTVNKAILIGRLGRDPELKYTPSGQAVATFSLATDESWKDKDGNVQSRVEWHNIVLWSKLGEIANEYLKKGSLVFIEGRLQTRSWEKDGVKRYTTEIVGQSMQMLGGKDGGSTASAPPTPPPSDDDLSGDPNPGVADDLPF